MSILRAVPERSRATSFRPRSPFLSRVGTLAVSGGLILLCSVLALEESRAESTPAAAEQVAEGEEVMVQVRANGVPRGEFVLLQVGGDFWVPASEFARLRLKPEPAARREKGSASFYSFSALGGTDITLDSAELLLSVDFPVGSYLGTRIDLSRRQPPPAMQKPANSAILNYRASVAQASDAVPLQLRLATELNLRVGNLLLRQESKYASSGTARGLRRGVSQVIWDDRAAGRRIVMGDVLVPGGAFGTVFTGAGVSVRRLYSMTPHVVWQPTPSVQVSTLVPSTVEVAVDGSTVYRTQVGPGPVDLDNLSYFGGARTVRVTVRDVTGRTQVIEQPFFFTDSVLARGLHEYSYFAGRRSELGPDDRWRYPEAAWQASHRYGLSDAVTVQAGGEGGRDFSTGGAGATWRSDLLGLVSSEVLGSVDHRSGRAGVGWAARYTYLGPQGAVFLGHRRLGEGYQTFATRLGGTRLRQETRVGGSLRIGARASLSGDAVLAQEAEGKRSQYAMRFSSYLTRDASLHAEYVANRATGLRDWAFNVFLRVQLEREHWAGTAVRADSRGRSVELEAGRYLSQGEGVGYRVGTTSTFSDEDERTFAVGLLNWNLRPATVELYAASQVRGGNTQQLEAAVTGALVAVDGYYGMTRYVGDGFALARLGVPYAGLEVYLNNQSQGRTDAAGDLLIPQVAAFGRQDVTVDDKQLPLEYNLQTRRVVIAPAYRSGTVVEFGGSRLRAYAGSAVLLREGRRSPVASRAWTLFGEAGALEIATSPAGDFYLEDAQPGRYEGKLTVDGRSYACRLVLPESVEAVTELQEGLHCE